ncbi:phage antirepressor N-terminal domain-containing protein [Francisella tularensis]|uniref:phage antirepressor N-terminal domain-containing protein n=1 Tax=Francisella tularensis TaxID=263 RepID=UPI0008F527AA|nr:phage antirepressor N-terminal domain-containing protein [Francisella tularensis]APA83241.1 putative antirepressor protein [Francisella tularensis subsp. novicida PA10-7858]
MQIQTIKFHEDNLLAVEHNGQHYVAMKNIVQSIGLQWEAQLKRIKRDTILSKGMSMMDIPTNSGTQSMILLPLKYLNGWLFGIDDKKVKNNQIREKILQYKEECYDVLNDYFKHGVAVNDNFNDTQAQIEILSSKVEDLQNKLSLATDFLTPKMKAHVRNMVKAKLKKEPLLTFQGIYSQLNDKFDVAKYDEIPREKYLEVCDFLGSHPLEEYRPKSKDEFLKSLPKWLRCSLKPTNELILIYGSYAYRVDEDINIFRKF